MGSGARPEGEAGGLRLAYAACGVLLAGTLAWGSLRGFPEGLSVFAPALAGICVVLLALEGSVRALRRRIEALERRPPPSEGPAPPPRIEGYDPGSRPRAPHP